MAVALLLPLRGPSPPSALACGGELVATHAAPTIPVCKLARSDTLGAPPSKSLPLQPAGTARASTCTTLAWRRLCSGNPPLCICTVVSTVTSHKTGFSVEAASHRRAKHHSAIPRTGAHLNHNKHTRGEGHPRYPKHGDKRSVERMARGTPTKRHSNRP